MRAIFTLFIATLLLTGCATSKIENLDQHSGFIPPSYLKKMKPTDLSNEQVTYRYSKPGVKWQNYQNVIIDPVSAWPEPRPTERVSQQTLDRLQHSLTSIVQNAFSRYLPITTHAGANTMRIQTVVTGVVVSNEGLAPYEFIPFALIKAGVVTAIGERDQTVTLYLETKVTDSVTGDILFAGIREITGENLPNATEKLKVGDLKGAFKAAENEISTSVRKAFQTTSVSGE